MRGPGAQMNNNRDRRNTPSRARMDATEVRCCHRRRPLRFRDGVRQLACGVSALLNY